MGLVGAMEPGEDEDEGCGAGIQVFRAGLFLRKGLRKMGTRTGGEFIIDVEYGRVNIAWEKEKVRQTDGNLYI